GPAELQEAIVGLGGEQGSDVVFALGVKAVVEVGYLLTQHAIGPHDFRRSPAAPVASIAAVDHEQMVEHRVVGILVAPRQQGERSGDGRHLLVEHFVAEPLGAPDLALLACQPDLERAEPAVDLGRLEALAEGASCKSPADEAKAVSAPRLEHQSRKHPTAPKSACKPS